MNRRVRMRVRLSAPLLTAVGCLAAVVAVAVAATTLPGSTAGERLRDAQLVAFEAAIASGPAEPEVVQVSAATADGVSAELESGAEVEALDDLGDLATEISTAHDGSALWHWLQHSDWLGFVGPAGWGATGSVDYAAAAATAVGSLGSVSAAEGGYAHPKALQAVAFALSRIGAPYVWGATGPTTFDCSGLMLRAYESIGVRLPRVSRHQFLVGERVALETLVPGDMVFFAHDVTRPASVHHVAMYIGAGQMVHAPYTGARVRVDKLRVRGLIGAVRMLPASGVPTTPPPFDIPGLPPTPQTPQPTPAVSPSSTAPVPPPSESAEPTPSGQPTPSGVKPTLVGPTVIDPPVVRPTLITPPIATAVPTLALPPPIYPTLIPRPPIVVGPPIVLQPPPPITIFTPPPVGPPLVLNPPPPIITGPIRP
jgi:hypothetical protein